METNVYNQKGEKVSEIKLADTVFNLPWNSDLVHQVVVAMTANKRTTVRTPKEEARSAAEAGSLGGRRVWARPDTALSGLPSGGRRRCPRPKKR